MLWGTRVQAESLLMIHLGKFCVKDSLDLFLQTPDTGLDTRKGHVVSIERPAGNIDYPGWSVAMEK